MTSRQKQRLMIVLLISTGVCVGLALIVYGLKQKANYFYSVSEVHDGQVAAGTPFRVGGVVVPGSVKRDDLQIQFQITDCAQTINITFEGILPDLFRERQGIVVDGSLGSAAHSVVASKVLAKHDENYMPPDVAESLKNQHNVAALDPTLCKGFAQK